MKKIFVIFIAIIMLALPGCTKKNAKEDKKDNIGFGGYKIVSLTGREEDHFIADDFCYIESDRYYVFMEKDIEIPGNFKQMLDDIVEDLEDATGLMFVLDDDSSNATDVCSVFYGYNPWEGFDTKGKIPLYLVVDRDAQGYVSGATGDYVDILDSAMYSMDFWQNNPKYSERLSRREEDLSYRLIAHELTHVLTSSNVTMNSIMTEGSADYFADVVMNTMQEKYGEKFCFRDNTYMWEIEQNIDETNAEAVFLEDFVHEENPSASYEYTYGRLICIFLEEKIGKDFLTKYKDALSKYEVKGEYGYFTESDQKAFSDAFKDAYGDTVFDDFGKWYAKNAKSIIEKQHNW